MNNTVELPRYKKCFVCGKENTIGLNLKFYASDDEVFYKEYPEVLAKKKVTFDFTPQEKHIGWKNTIHGGIIASMLDESMFWAVAVNSGTIYLTTDLNIRYIKAINLPVDLKGTAWALVKRQKSRMHTALAELRDIDGVLYAKAEAKFFAIPKENIEEFIEDMYFESDPNKKFSKDDILVN